jgi:diaminopimelate decarboxylase
MPWWQTPHLSPVADDLVLGGVSVAQLARDRGTPLYAYAPAQVRDRLRLLASLLSKAGVEPKLRYAMKANRHPAVLAAAREVGGVDTCSPRELIRALGVGFRAEDIAFTAGSLTDADLRVVADAGVTPTLDTRAGLRRWARIAGRGAAVGLRIDPGAIPAWGDDPKLSYGDSKFGVKPEDLEAVLAEARALDLQIVGLHVHPGWGMPEHAETALRRGLSRMAEVAGHLRGLEWLDVGGGLGGQYRAADHPLRPETWAAAIGEILGPLRLPVLCEPGTFIVALAGVLVLEVTYSEVRGGHRWVGVNGGHALNPCPALYGIPLEILKVADPLGPRPVRGTVAGNINEAGDVWGRNLDLPELDEGDLVALVPGGAYGASMASDHCLRGGYAEVAVEAGRVVG